MMYSFIKEQKICNIKDLKIGGQPGQYPTVLFGTVFYGKKFKLMDDKAMEAAKNDIEHQEKSSLETGVPAVVDVYVRGIEFIQKQMDLVLDAVKGPISLDSSDAKTRAETLKYLSEVGELDRTIYNSINLGVTQEEIDALTEYTPACAVVLGYNPRDMSVDGRAEILNTGANMISFSDKGLLDMAEDVGIKNLILDTGATPFGSMSCETIRAIPVFKNRFGLPVGCSIHNTLESWKWMKARRQEDEVSYSCANASANSLVPAMSGDFIVYGPAESAHLIFPSIAFVDKLVAEGAFDYFGIAPDKDHPYHKLE